MLNKDNTLPYILKLEFFFYSFSFMKSNELTGETLLYFWFVIDIYLDNEDVGPIGTLNTPKKTMWL